MKPAMKRIRPIHPAPAPHPSRDPIPTPTRPAFPAMRALLTLALLAAAPTAPAQPGSKWHIDWTDHPGNPVDLQSPGSRAYMPYVLHRHDWPPATRFQVWYDTESINGIAFSTSADGINWSAGQPLTGLNTDGSSSSGRPVVLYDPAWDKPYRLYYYGNPGGIWQIRVAESPDGIAFENDQVALEGGRLGTFPDGHAVARIPGRTPDSGDPSAERPYLMYFRSNDGIAIAESEDGYFFEEIPDDFDTDGDDGLIRLHPEGTFLNGQPSQVLQLAQNDFRMFLFTGNTENHSLVSANGIDWEIGESPMDIVGSSGPGGSWNDERNYYVSVAYLGEGRFYLLRGGRSIDTTLYRSGAAFGLSEFYRDNDPGRWAGFSPMDDFVAEGWTPFSTTGNEPDADLVALIQNADGTLSVRDRLDSGNFYAVRNVAFTVPFTYEFRARLDDATGTGGDAEFPKYMVGVFQTDLLHPGGEAWQPAFAATRFGGWALASNPTAEVDNTQFQTFTVVGRFDEAARYRLARNPNDGPANVALCVFDVYLNRDFSAPAVTFNNTGFVGWPDSVDADGRLDIGFPGPSAGQVTVDWVRWGSGIILDPQDPGGPAPATTLTLTRTGTTLAIGWSPAGGTLQSAPAVSGTWSPVGPANPATVNPTDAARFYRVAR